MATRESLADPSEPIHSRDVPVLDNGDGVSRITIPKHIREMLDIEPGEEISLSGYRDRIVLRPKED